MTWIGFSTRLSAPTAEPSSVIWLQVRRLSAILPGLSVCRSPRVSKHLGELERGGLVTREARGRERVYRINPDTRADACDRLGSLERFRTGCLETLEVFVGTTPESSNKKMIDFMPRVARLYHLGV